MKHTFTGSGPGRQTPDGCSVELYRALPYMGELVDVASLLQAGHSALDLGCGSGRLAAELHRLGLRVSGVDESPDMLALLPPGIEPIQSSIESLRLNRTFDVVLLASHLINHPDQGTRRLFAECSRRHLEPGGRLLLQRQNPHWLATAEPGTVGRAGPILVAVEDVSRHSIFVEIRLCYESIGQAWHQSFSAATLSEQDIEAILLHAGFGHVSWHGSARLWASAIAR